MKCQQKQIALGLSASRDVWSDVVTVEVPVSMEEAPLPPPPAQPPPVVETSSETDAMTLAAVRPYGHEHAEISRAEFDSIIRNSSNVEEDTLEDFPTEEVV